MPEALSPPGLLLALPDGPDRRPATPEAAGRAFEALVLAQMLKASRHSAEMAGPGGPDAETGAAWRELAEREAARALAATSPLGLAQLLARAAAAEERTAR